MGLASTYSHFVTIHYDALCRPTLDAVLEQLQALRAALRRTTEPLAPYDIEALIVRKATIGTAKNRPRSSGPTQGAGLRSPILQQQGTGVGNLVSRSTHAGRMYQQQSTHSNGSTERHGGVSLHRRYSSLGVRGRRSSCGQQFRAAHISLQPSCRARRGPYQ